MLFTGSTWRWQPGDGRKRARQAVRSPLPLAQTLARKPSLSCTNPTLTCSCLPCATPPYSASRIAALDAGNDLNYGKDDDEDEEEEEDNDEDEGAVDDGQDEAEDDGTLASQEEAAAEAAAAAEAEAEAEAQAETEAAEEARRQAWAQYYAWQMHEQQAAYAGPYGAAPASGPYGGGGGGAAAAASSWGAPYGYAMSSPPPYAPAAPSPSQNAAGQVSAGAKPGAASSLPPQWHHPGAPPMPPMSQPAAPSAAAPGGSNYETDLSNLIMAWYHCGFFTAKFQERYPR